MSLRRCPECQNPMSTRATFCGHCGWVKRRSNNNDNSFAILVTVIGLIIALVVALLFVTGNLKKTIRLVEDYFNPYSAMHRSPSEEQKITEQALRLIQKRIGKSTFSNVFLNKTEMDDVSITTVCGTVSNQKTVQLFIAAPEIDRSALEKQDKGFNTLWNSLCVSK